MTRTEYLEQLDSHLRKLPKTDYEEAMAYFREYFDEAGEENEAMVMAELGTPREAARDLLSNLVDKRVSADNRPIHSKTKTIWLVILAICALPLGAVALVTILGLLLALLVTVLSLLIAAAVTCLALIIGAAVFIWDGLSFMSQSISVGLMGLGAGLGLVGLAILLAITTYLFGHWSIRGLKALVKWMIKKGKRA